MIKLAAIWSLTAILLLPIVRPVVENDAKTIEGEWQVRTDLAGQAIDALLTLAVDDDGLLTGTWTSRGRIMALDDLAFENSTLRFTRDTGSEVMKFEGVIEGDRITGAYEASLGTLAVTGTRRPRAPDPPRGRPTLLDGREQSFIVVGSTISLAWPAMLQEMLDAHSDGERLYHVQNASVTGAPVDRWIGEERRFYRATSRKMLDDFFGEEARLREGDEPTAKTALCQQTLQYLQTERGPVPRADDVDGIRVGANALERFAVQLRQAGVERVIFSMHVYQRPTEPRTGNERFALKALLERGHDFIEEGPDVWSITFDRADDAYDSGGVHPNEFGMKLIAAAWYRRLAGAEARDDVVDDMFARNYDVFEMRRQFLDWRAGNSDVRPGVVLEEATRHSGSSTRSQTPVD